MARHQDDYPDRPMMRFPRPAADAGPPACPPVLLQGLSPACVRAQIALYQRAHAKALQDVGRSPVERDLLGTWN